MILLSNIASYNTEKQPEQHILKVRLDSPDEEGIMTA